MTSPAHAAPLDPLSAPERGMQRVQTTIFLAAVIAINYTLFRPSPVDILFVTALACTLFVRQTITAHSLAYFFLIFVWIGSLFISSIPLMDDPEVSYQMLKISFAVSIGLCACLIATRWRLIELQKFLRVWIVSACIAATLGMVGFIFDVPDLVWDGRAKGYLDDPNMYGAFLLPALFGCLYMISRRERPKLYSAALLWLFFGLVLSFSRVALSAFVVWGGLYVLVLNRRRLVHTVFFSAVAVAVLLGLVLCALVFVDGFGEKLADRLTLAKDYDLGHQGRLARYIQSIGFILDNPLGMGLLQIEKIFPEPIHNIWISAFLNFGWAAGLSWSLLMLFSVTISIANYRRTGDGICLTIFFAWLAIVSCALLHEAERWRHLWLFTGLVWGLNYRNFAPALPKIRPRPAPAAPALAAQGV